MQSIRPVIYMFVFCFGIAGSAACQDFSFEKYNQYRYDLYLGIPLPWLRSASVRLQMGDTSGAIKDIGYAIDKGLYEPVRLVNSQFSALTGKKEWKELNRQLNLRRSAYADPKKIELNTADISHFFRFLPGVNKPNADELLMREYILPGTPGLKAFFDLKLNSRPEIMVSKIRSELKFYQSCDQLEKSVAALLPDIRVAALKLKKLYPPSIFPPIYFMVGIFNIGGTPDIGNGLLIGSEFFAGSYSTDTTQLTANEKFAMYDTSRLLPVVIHEFIHIEQKHPWGANLLEQCIIEGACDFIATKLIQKDINPRLHVYGNTHEKELWLKFEKEKMRTDYSDWLYNGSKMNGTGIPSNLGYYIGYKICESYYAHNSNLERTITDILETTDFKDFLDKSDYGKKIN